MFLIRTRRRNYKTATKLHVFYGMCGTDFRILSPRSVEANILQHLSKQVVAGSKPTWSTYFTTLRQPIWPEVRDSRAQRLCDCDTNRKNWRQTKLFGRVLASTEHVFGRSKYPRRYNQNEEWRKSLEWLLPRGKNYRSLGSEIENILMFYYFGFLH